MFNVGTRDANLGKKKRSITRNIFFGPNSVRIIAFLLLAVFSLFYLSQSSQSATKTIRVSDLEQQEKSIMAEKERLEVEANRLKALSIIQEKASGQGMEQISN